jgi:hypothetical protein
MKSKKAKQFADYSLLRGFLTILVVLCGRLGKKRLLLAAISLKL